MKKLISRFLAAITSLTLTLTSFAVDNGKNNPYTPKGGGDRKISITAVSDKSVSLSNGRTYSFSTVFKVRIRSNPGTPSDLKVGQEIQVWSTDGKNADLIEIKSDASAKNDKPKKNASKDSSNEE